MRNIKFYNVIQYRKRYQDALFHGINLSKFQGTEEIKYYIRYAGEVGAHITRTTLTLNLSILRQNGSV